MAKVIKKPLQCFAFLGYHWPSTVLQTEILPYLAITDVPLKTPGKKLLTNTFTHISNVNLIFKTNMFFSFVYCRTDFFPSSYWQFHEI